MDPGRLSIELFEEVAAIMRTRITSGRNASESEVIQEALELPAEQDASLEEGHRQDDHPKLEAWLRDEVVPAYEEWKASGEKGMTANEVRASLARRRSARRPAAAE
jgi:Arc/MetJ-type ribon-helix-helix transcriptional regulator